MRVVWCWTTHIVVGRTLPMGNCNGNELFRDDVDGSEDRAQGDSLQLDRGRAHQRQSHAARRGVVGLDRRSRRPDGLDCKFEPEPAVAWNLVVARAFRHQSAPRCGKSALNMRAAGKTMRLNVTRHWMWSEAIEMLDRAERLHREVFRPTRTASRVPTWEPPIDVMETERAVIVLVALPGVEPGRIDVSLDHDVLSLSGTRSFPRELDAALIHRLELPQGRFERHVSLPPGGYAAVRSTAADGCLTIVLEKRGALGG